MVRHIKASRIRIRKAYVWAALVKVLPTDLVSRASSIGTRPLALGLVNCISDARRDGALKTLPKTIYTGVSKVHDKHLLRCGVESH